MRICFSILDTVVFVSSLIGRHRDRFVFRLAPNRPVSITQLETAPNAAFNRPPVTMGKWRSKLYKTDRARDFDHERVS